MKKLILGIILLTACFIFPSKADALIEWEWEFTNSGLVWDDTDIVTAYARITNLPTSTERLMDLTGFSVGHHSQQFIPLYDGKFGSNGNFGAEIALLDLAPGESFVFPFYTYTPKNGGPVPAGHYFAGCSTLSLNFANGPLPCPSLSVSNEPFNAIILGPSTVPEPATMLLFLPGLVGIVARSRKLKR